MSTPRFIGDLHLGHKKIVEFSGPLRGNVTTVDEHDEWIVKQWNKVVSKTDIVYVHGDICFDKEKLPLLDRMKGRKILLLGNHDQFDLSDYQKYFEKIHGFMKYKGFWLSHSPIHPAELRGKVNVHGHVHHNTIADPRYINVSVEALNGMPIRLDELRDLVEKRKSQHEKI